MKHLQIIFFLLIGVSSTYGQSEETIGVSPYIEPSVAEYRLLFGAGGNDGLSAQTPQSYIGSLSHQVGEEILSLGFISNNAVAGGFPRITYTEVDLLYGLSLDDFLMSYSRPTYLFHAALSAGISVNDYSTRWRRFNRGDTSFIYGPPNSTEVAIGLPVQLQAIYEPFRHIGFGTILFYDLSKLQPSYGGAIILELRL